MKRLKLGNIGLESFDQAPTGNVVAPTAQPPQHEQPLTPTSGYFEAPFSGQENYAAEDNAEHDASQLWKRIKSAFDVENTQEEREILELNGPATDSAIHALGSYAHGKISPLLAAVLKIHNGQHAWWEGEGSDGAEYMLPNCTVFFSAENMLKVSKETLENKDKFDDWYGPIQENDERIRKVQWSQHWIVLAASEDKRPTYYVLDYDPAHGGKPGQVIKVDMDGNSRHYLGESFEKWFNGFVNRLTQHTASMESLTKPLYPLRTAMESDAVVVDEDELDQFVLQANSLSTMLNDTSGMAMEEKKSPSDIAKSKMHLRFKKLKDGFVDTFRSAAGMAAKYEKQLDELENELLQGHVHGQIKVNMSGMWQHFSDEKGPITHNLLGKVKEDLAFSTYILTDFSHKAFEQLKLLSQKLHTGQGTSDEQAKRTALDVEQLHGPAEYMDKKWLCAAGEQPYLSVTGIHATQGHHPRPVAIEGVSLDKLAELATPYRIREYGSFMHGVKKLFVNDSKKDTHFAAEDLAKFITTGRAYISAARTYMEIYNAVWPIFHRLDAACDLIWDDFDLVEYEIETEHPDGSVESETWRESGTGPIRRREQLYYQLLDVVSNFSDAVLQPGVHELARALRAAKFHGYLVAAGIKAAEGRGDNDAKAK